MSSSTLTRPAVPLDPAPEDYRRRAGLSVDERRPARLRPALGRLLRGSAAILVFAALWETAPRTGLVDAVFLPPLSTSLGALADLVGSGQLTEHLRASLTRALVGLSIAIATAIPLGALIGRSASVARFLNPVLELFRNTAALALLPVFVLILGIGETSKIALVVYACFFPVLLSTITGVRTVDPLLLKSARSLGLRPLQLFTKVTLPAAVPTIFTGVRMAGAASILVLVAAEMVGARAGLGYLVTAAQQNFQIPAMYAGIITIALVGLTINAVLLLAERRLSRWRPTS
ncbi:ABC transporter permease [Cellulomonas humilata]|uniref:NitT/TauT family transport system permease protein n=1 Tax=Cellulomonas humilata TaxID=144055 RepID=A0ABU0ED36_9CELL|nr:ABC transporter permease [Cellulomonas humilata]MDQ0372742.1 NitT/TauT family transport system permease protein [Cellulomonas humilata]